MSYNSVCIELLRSLLFTLYIHSLCASRRAELARGQRRWAVLYMTLKARFKTYRETLRRSIKEAKKMYDHKVFNV